MSKPAPLLINNQDNYRELCKPFATTEEAEAAVVGFWSEFYELRNKYKLPDVYAIFRIPIADQEGDVLTSMHAGSSLQSEAMTAWAFGREQSDRQARITKLVGANAAVTRKGME